ncbi:unnamed protein product [Miscanthus lutarioriparius]|uniref:Uncharacterized protein n=1 Tax=Miscanthus lutarioriparius TaxID=422564 RepID=A0A811SI42_9POAL|nr:unnamed protein product [Miscanthus lutarioriparius]
MAVLYLLVTLLATTATVFTSPVKSKANEHADVPAAIIVSCSMRPPPDICCRRLPPFRPGDPTSAKTYASNGEVVRVSFTLRPLPGASRLCVHLPKGRKLSGFDSVVAAHGNAVLFRLEIDFNGLPSSCSTVDHLIYWASPCGPRISLLPRWYSTEDEIEAAEVGSWRRNPWMALGRRGTGFLICDREDFVVAELHLDVDRLEDVDASLEAQLFRLCSSRERIAAGGGEWEVKHTRARGGKAKFGDLLCWWEASMVIPYGSYLVLG